MAPMAAHRCGSLDRGLLIIAALVAVVVRPSSANAGSLMRRDRVKKSTSPLQVALERVLEGEAARRLFAVEASVRPSFEAFPKNAKGQIPSEEIFPAIVRNYFAKEHGWVLNGLFPPLMQRLPGAGAEVQNASILRSKAPNVADALADLRRSDLGLSLSDVVGTIAAMEHLLVEESVQVLRNAYFLNNFKVEDLLFEDKIHEVLQSYLLLFRYGTHGNAISVEEHHQMRERARQAADWDSIVQFEREVFNASGKSWQLFDFDAATNIVREMAQRYGKWQNHECVEMKDTLMRIAVDHGAGGSGRVPLAAFSAEPPHATYQFTESPEYLRQIGVLEETGDHEPQVYIANYLVGPSNCIAPSMHYTVCCLNECEGVISDIETKTQSPVWAPDRLLEIVEGTPSSTAEAPRKLPEAVAKDLRGVGERHEGVVALHSPDFKKWLHAAFPNECPDPTPSEMVAEEAELRAAAEWLAHQEECTRLPAWHPASPAVIEV